MNLSQILHNYSSDLSKAFMKDSAAAPNIRNPPESLPELVSRKLIDESFSNLAEL